MPNTGFGKITAAFTANYKMRERLNVSARFHYTNKQRDNLTDNSYHNLSIAYFIIFQNLNADLNWYQDRWKNGACQADQIHPFNSFIDTPFLLACKMTNAVNSNNVVGNLAATDTI